MVASDNDSTNNNSITCASSILAATSNYKTINYVQLFLHTTKNILATIRQALY